MEKRTKILTAVAAVFVIASTGVAFAKDHGGGRMGHMANPEAIAACANQTEGANVVFNHPMWGNVNAVCGKTRDNKLVALPAKMACAGQFQNARRASAAVRHRMLQLANERLVQTAGTGWVRSPELAN